MPLPQGGTNGPRAALFPPQRCMERLRSSRAKLLDRYRQAGDRVCGPATGALLVREVMELEWQTLQAGQQSLPALGSTEALAQVSADAWAGTAWCRSIRDISAAFVCHVQSVSGLPPCAARAGCCAMKCCR